MADMSLRTEKARLEYEKAKRLEEEQKIYVQLGKDQSKLEKIDQLKKQLKSLQKDAPRVRHRTHWSSLAEPDLSPIAQSLMSTLSSE
jgi:thymidylate synthase